MKKHTVPSQKDIVRKHTTMRNGARQEGSITRLKQRADKKREPKTEE